MNFDQSFAGPPGLPDRYRVERLLGQGGFASVVKAIDQTTGNLVAIKVLHAQYVGDTKRCRRFQREVRVCQRLNHPNIITVHSAVVTPRIAYLVMEYLEAKDLATILKERRLPLDESYRIIAQIASALVYIHEQGLVHRDIKPDNVMVGSGLRVVLTDFNLVRLPHRSSLSGVGDALGTPLYVAPEVVMGDDATPASDMYALGLTFFELLTGKPPYQGRGLGVLLKAIVETAVPPPSSLNPLVPAEIDTIIARCTNKNPDQRYPDGGALLRDLSRVGPAAHAAVSAVEPYTPSLGGSKRFRFLSTAARTIRAWLKRLRR